MTRTAADVMLALHAEDFDAPIPECGRGLRELVEGRLATYGPPGGLPRLTRNGSVLAAHELRSRLH